jgi:hypothetical protein
MRTATPFYSTRGFLYLLSANLRSNAVYWHGMTRAGGAHILVLNQSCPEFDKHTRKLGPEYRF